MKFEEKKFYIIGLTVERVRDAFVILGNEISNAIFGNFDPILTFPP